MHRFLAAASLLALVSCGGQAPPAFPTPSATVISAPVATGVPSRIDQVNRGIAAAEQTLTLAYKAALVYTELPRCGPTAARLCSDRAVVKQIRDRAIQAHNALIVARQNEANVELLVRAWGAIEAFRAIVPAS